LDQACRSFRTSPLGQISVAGDHEGIATTTGRPSHAGKSLAARLRQLVLDTLPFSLKGLTRADGVAAAKPANLEMDRNRASK
jgi:hypothetical protein